MLAAVVPTDDKVWFIKMVGNGDEVAKHVDGFRQLISSITFENDAANPRWDLPEGWAELAGSGMRFATLKAGDAEASVISLPAPQNVEANVNRWRGQLRLPPLSSAETPERISMGEREAFFVDLMGESDPSKMMGNAPLATGGPKKSSVPENSSDVVPPSPSGFDYELPTGWTAGRAGGMRKAAFNIQRGEQTAEMTVITLPGNVGGALNNVNRWRGQVGLEEIDQEQLDESQTALQIDGIEAKLIDLVGPESATDQKSMLAAMMMRDGISWFFKLMGPADLVAAEKENFDSFVNSVRFSSPVRE